MEYLCLRNCYTTEDKYYRGGETYDLPDDMEKSPKNFQLVGADTIPEGTVEEAPLYISPNPKKKTNKRKT